MNLDFPLLELAILIPLAGAAIVARIRDSETARLWSLGFLGAAFACTLGELLDFSVLQARTHMEIAHDPGLFARSLHDFLEIDALSAPLLPLTALIYLLTAIATLRTKIRR